MTGKGFRMTEKGITKRRMSGKGVLLIPTQKRGKE
jgi:hypothetical protein